MSEREKTETEKQADAIAELLADSVKAGDYETAQKELDALQARIDKAKKQ